MPLSPGQQLGSFEIVSSIGAGGMGEVYRARDAKLGRDVALKILPPLFTNDPDRLARFRREAQVLASLNHSNIGHIYGFEDPSTGPGQAGVHALVLELIDGPTLADRLARGPIPLDEALPIARQIAEALEAAHEHGVIHRDLKPANVKVRDDGAVKVLDFGLAKATDPAAGSSSDALHSPTMTNQATALGIIIGTAAYMSPEQARGRAADKRADIWAFGVLVFEMLTGRRLFDGETISDTIASVLRQDIDWRALPAGTPAALERLLRRCLDRDPKHRMRDIGEARIALESRDETPVASAPRSRRFGLIHAVVAGLVLALTITGGLLWRSGRAEPSEILRLSASLPPERAFNLAGHPVLAISRDGATLALVASAKGIAQLYVRPLREFDPRLLPGTEGASAPFFSPDGAWIGFFADGKLKKVPAAGGPVITLADVTDNRGGAWTSDDTIVYAPQPIGPLHQIPAAGGTPRPVVALDEEKHERTHRWPSVLPDGQTILFTVGSAEHPDDYDDATIEAVRVDTGARRLVVKGGRMGQYAATGHLLFLRGKILYAIPLDLGQLTVSGSPVPVLDGVAGDTTTGAGDYALAERGTLIFVPGDPSGGQHLLAWVDVKGDVSPIDLPPALYGDPKVSPDGRRLVVSVIESSSARNIQVIDPARGTASKLTFGGINRTPLWSRDGAFIYYLSYEMAGNLSVVMRKAADGSGDAQRVREIRGQVYLEDLTPDGSALIMSASGTGKSSPSVRGLLVAGDRSTIRRLPLAPGATGEPSVIVTATSDVFGAVVSPDARRLAYVSAEGGRSQVFVQSFDSGQGRVQVSTAGGTEPHWSPDGRSLYYLNNDELVAVPIEPGATFVPGRPKTLFNGVTYISIDSAETYHVSPKGDRFVMMRPAGTHATSQEVRAILNWFGELRRATSKK
jgi:Tol biopolymer transport system component